MNNKMKRVQTEGDVAPKRRLSKIKLGKKKQRTPRQAALTLKNPNHLSIPLFQVTPSSGRFRGSLRTPGSAAKGVFQSFRAKATPAWGMPLAFSFTPKALGVLESKPRTPKAERKSEAESRALRKIEKLASFAAVDSEKLKRHLRRRKSKAAERESIRGQRPREFAKSQLTEFIKHKLSKLDLEQDISATEREMAVRRLWGPAEEAWDFKDNFDLKAPRVGAALAPLGLQQKLLLTGERNRALRRSVRCANPSESVLREMQRRKRERNRKQFKRVFCRDLGLGLDAKKKKELYQYLKQKVPKRPPARKRLAPEGKENASRAGERALSRREEQAGSAKRGNAPGRLRKFCRTQETAPKSTAHSKWLPKPFGKGKARQKAKTREKAKPLCKGRAKKEGWPGELREAVSNSKEQAPFDLQLAFKAHAGFLEFLKRDAALLRHFEAPLSGKVFSQYEAGNLLRSALYSREDLAECIRRCRAQFRKETDLRSRLHLVVMLGAELAFKLRGVYREQGDFLALLFAQLARDLEAFRELVGQTLYATVKGHQVELRKIEARKRDLREHFARQMDVLRESHRKSSQRGVVVKEECSLMKKLIYELQIKNEQYLGTIARLKEATPERQCRTDPLKIRHRFKKIIGRLLPKHTRGGRDSFLDISKRIVKKSLNRRLRKSSQAGCSPRNNHARQSFVNSQTLFQSKMCVKEKPFRQKHLRMFTQVDSRSENIYSSKSEDSSQSRKEAGLLHVTEKKSCGSPLFAEDEQLTLEGKLSRWAGVCRLCGKGGDDRVRREKTKSVSNAAVGTQKSCGRDTRIGPYLLKDIEAVSRFYLLPDRCVRHKAVQEKPAMVAQEVQTEVSLTLPIYDEVFKNMGTFRAFIQDFVLRRNFSSKDICQRIADLKSIKNRSRHSEKLSFSQSGFLKSSLKRFPSKNICGLYTKVNSSDVFTNNALLYKRVSIRMDLGTPKAKRDFAGAHDLSKSAFNQSVKSHKHFKPACTPFLRNTSDQGRAKGAQCTQSKCSFLPMRSEFPPRKQSSKQWDAQPSQARSIVISQSASASQGSEAGPPEQQKDLEQLCRKVFENFIRRKVVNNKANLRSKEKFLKHVTAFLLSEEIKNKSLLSKNRRFQLVLGMLKKVIRVPATFRHLRKNRSFSRGRVFPEWPEDCADKESPRDSLVSSSKASDAPAPKQPARSKSCPRLQDFLRTLVASKRSPTQRMFKAARFQRLWGALHKYLSCEVVAKCRRVGQGGLTRPTAVVARAAGKLRLLRPLRLF